MVCAMMRVEYLELPGLGLSGCGCGLWAGFGVRSKFGVCHFLSIYEFLWMSCIVIRGRMVIFVRSSAEGPCTGLAGRDMLKLM